MVDIFHRTARKAHQSTYNGGSHIGHDRKGQTTPKDTLLSPESKIPAMLTVSEASYGLVTSSRRWILLP